MIQYMSILWKNLVLFSNYLFISYEVLHMVKKYVNSLSENSQCITLYSTHWENSEILSLILVSVNIIFWDVINKFPLFADTDR